MQRRFHDFENHSPDVCATENRLLPSNLKCSEFEFFETDVASAVILTSLGDDSVKCFYLIGDGVTGIDDEHSNAVAANKRDGDLMRKRERFMRASRLVIADERFPLLSETIIADEEQLFQALLNYLDRAISLDEALLLLQDLSDGVERKNPDAVNLIAEECLAHCLDVGIFAAAAPLRRLKRLKTVFQITNHAPALLRRAKKAISEFGAKLQGDLKRAEQARRGFIAPMLRAD